MTQIGMTKACVSTYEGTISLHKVHIILIYLLGYVLYTQVCFLYLSSYKQLITILYTSHKQNRAAQ